MYFNSFLSRKCFIDKTKKKLITKNNNFNLNLSIQNEKTNLNAPNVNFLKRKRKAECFAYNSLIS